MDHKLDKHDVWDKMVYMFMEFFRIVLTLTRPYSDYALTFFYRIIWGSSKALPPIQNRILLLSATELAEKIRKKQLRCEDVMRVYVDRSREVHSYINAAVDERYEAAIQDACAVDAFLEHTTKSEEEIAKETSLLGVPFSCKEAIGVKGMAQTSGMIRAKERKALKDSDSAALYRKAGAIPVMVTNVPELCMWWESANLNFGMTVNPYDNARTVGGSSGGEGAILTSAAAVIGIGNDIAGSIRIPASFCGIYGHKPSKGLVSNMGCFPESDDEFDQFVSTGPMCRYVQDLPLLLRVLSNDSDRFKWNKKVDFKKVKVYYMDSIPDFWQGAVPDVRESILKAARYFEEEYGIKAIPANILEMKYAFNMWECKLLECGGPSFKFALAGGLEGKKSPHINLHWELIKSLFRKSEHTLPAIYFGLVDRRDKDDFYHQCLHKYDVLRTKFEEILSGDAIFLLPTYCETPPHYLETIPKYPNVGYTCIFSILGFPSTAIPAGFSNGLPIGIQAISTKFQDHLCLAAAQELDKVFGGWISPCPVRV